MSLQYQHLKLTFGGHYEAIKIKTFCCVLKKIFKISFEFMAAIKII